jgi:hypothetical protein
MAGLSPTPFGVTNSVLGFKALRLPPYLDSRKVVDSWWLKSKNISDEDGAAVVSTSNNSKQVLFLLAEFVNNNPRVCEFVARYIQLELESSINNGLTVDKTFMASLLRYVLDEISLHLNFLLMKCYLQWIMAKVSIRILPCQ